MRTVGRVLIVAMLVLGALHLAESTTVGASNHVAGQFYRLEWPYRNIYAQATVDYVQVTSAGSGQAGGRIGIWNTNGACAYVQFKVTGGIWHQRTDKVCDKRMNQWVWYYWKDNFVFYPSGSYSFRTCISDWLRDSCGREYTIKVLVT